MQLRRFHALFAACGALVLVPLAAEAQEPAPPPAPGGVPELVFEREVFQYPTFTRRNPFRPQSAAEGGGPRYEQLSVTGIMYDPDPTYSVAILTTGGINVNDDGTITAVEGDAYNAKVGQRIGNTTIREIQRDRVLVDVEEFGLIERRTMTIASRRPGGSQ